MEGASNNGHFGERYFLALVVLVGLQSRSLFLDVLGGVGRSSIEGRWSSRSRDVGSLLG
jgi:hypothetical protein